MKASINWLKEFVDFSLSPEEIAKALTMAGLEVEDILPDSQDGGDAILEISVTPNRPDCLSIKGIAREISAILSLPFKEPSLVIPKEEGKCLAIEIKNSQLCRRYAGRIVRDVRVGPSPTWISKRLESHGLRTVNNIVDITNYMLLETGQPLHAFDLDKIKGTYINVSTPKSITPDLRTKIKTIDRIEHEVSDDSLLIWDTERPIAIAGVMGGLNTEVELSTANILLESACFNPVSVRRTSRALNLITESSYRFERGVDIEGAVPALNRATQLIIEIAGGKATKMIDNYPEPFKPSEVSVKFAKVNNLLGISVKPSIVHELLARLGFKHKRAGEGITVVPPSFRQDIQRDIDVIEEIARLYGYDKIPTTLPTVSMKAVVPDYRQAGHDDRLQSEVLFKRNLVRAIKDSMKRSGYSEVINYSFLNPSVFNKLRLHLNDRRREVIKIRNPLRKEEDALRTTLIPSLLENVSLNVKQGEKSVRFFEVSKVFLPSQKQTLLKVENLPSEPLNISAVHLKDSKTFSLWQERHEGFYDLKGALENLFLELRIKNYSFTHVDPCEPFLHPWKSCAIKVDGEDIGFLGVLHPLVSEVFDLTGDISVFELDMDRVLSHIPLKIFYMPLPKYPYVERDISIIVSQETQVEDVKNTILSADSDIIESVTLFDIYTGPPIPEEKKSLAFSIRYRAENRTLTDNEVDAVQSRIVDILKNSFKAELRG